MINDKDRITNIIIREEFNRVVPKQEVLDEYNKEYDTGLTFDNITEEERLVHLQFFEEMLFQEYLEMRLK